MINTTSRPCPICRGTNADDCMACRGAGSFPYPWILPEDNTHPVRWAGDEAIIVIEADTPKEAVQRYRHIFGDGRSEAAVYRFWTRHTDGTVTAMPRWTHEERITISKADDSPTAVEYYRAEIGTTRTDSAIRGQFYRLRKDTDNEQT